MRALLAGTVLSFCFACAHEAPPPPPPAKPATPYCAYASESDGTQSVDILCNDPIAVHVKVKHILVAWRELASPDRPLDPRAEQRSYADAQALARELLGRVRAGEAIEPLMDEYSEDPGSAHTGRAYDASPDAALVSQFKSLSLRLKPREAGIVKSAYGLHVIQRTE